MEEPITWTPSPALKPGEELMELRDTPTPEQFRAVGFTAEAANYPLSLAGQAIIAQHNGVLVESLPETFRYSSGPYMHAWIEALGTAPVKRHENGRWLLPKEIEQARIRRTLGHSIGTRK